MEDKAYKIIRMYCDENKPSRVIHKNLTLEEAPKYKYTSFDAAFGDLRCGKLKPGDRVKVWCQEEGHYVIGTMRWYAGQPSILEEE